MTNHKAARQLEHPSYTVADSCGVCNRNDLESVWSLEKLPFTETFGSFDPNYPSQDQRILICQACGHFQLEFQVSPAFLYNPLNYHFKSSGQKRHVEESELLKFIQMHTTAHVNNVLEFGANDLGFSIRMLSMGIGKFVHAVDPLAPENSGHDRLASHQLMITDYLSEIGPKFDLVIARHTMEHISNPLDLLRLLQARITNDSVIIMEFPNLASIVKGLRGDAFFHQHYHYFDLSSVMTLAAELGMELIGHRLNHRGSNGGSIMVALKKSKVTGLRPERIATATAFGTRHPMDRAMGFVKFQSIFRQQMSVIAGAISLNSPVFGLGAGLMLPVLDYHLGGAVQELGTVLDDDPAKHGTSYSNLRVQIRSPASFRFPEVFNLLITSTENLRVLSKRSDELGASKIISLSIT